MKMVVVVVEVHGVAVHEVHGEQPHEVVVLHACHGPRRQVCL